MKRSAFYATEIGDTFYHAYAFCFATEAADGSVIEPDESPTEIFDLLSEAKAFAKKEAKARGSLYEWCVEARDLGSMTRAFGIDWKEQHERWSSVGGHEGRECFR